MNEATLKQKIECFIFYEGGSVTVKQILQVTGAAADDVTIALDELTKEYADRGMCITRSDSEVSLRVSPACSDFIQSIHKDSLSKDIGPAALEVLGILLYRGKSSQADIDSIRGVNSAFSLRTLRIRGLISKNQEAESVFYNATPEALAHLGVTDTKSLPDYEKMKEKLGEFERKTTQQDNQNIFADTDSDEGDNEQSS
ncbi:MAG: segregation and condensation protein segregation and condensation protein [Candidatus Parcubacteria bacterium]